MPEAKRYLILLALVFGIGGVAAYFGNPVLFGNGKISGCRANHYSSDNYLAYCASTGYGDYEHGAFYFDMDTTVHDALARTDVVFLGNSITQFAFSTDATKHEFAAHQIHYYLLGFAYFETIDFALTLVPRLPLHPKIAVINADEFFWQDAVSPPAASLQTNPASERIQYQEKRMWQTIHAWVCGTPFGKKTRLCGETLSIFRSRSDGAWVGLSDWGLTSRPLVAGAAPAAARATEIERRAQKALRLATALHIPPQCLVVTTIPHDKISRSEGVALAQEINAAYIAPEVGGLATIDGIHLDKASAELWSHAFIDALINKLPACMASPR